MSKYSEMIGSFIRMGNFPMEANYIFATESELKEFYSNELNKATLHKGLFRIVVDDGTGVQALYWCTKKQTNDELEFVKLINYTDIEDLNDKIQLLVKKLKLEVLERTEAVIAIWGTDTPTQVPDDLNSLLDLAEAVIELRENIQAEINRATQVENSLKEDIKKITGTTEEDIIKYIDVNLDYKSLTELSEALHKFLNTTDSENDLINTLPELQSFLSGYKDTDVLSNILKKIVNDIMGDPLPSEEFRTLRGIEDFIRILKADSENSDSNLQLEIDQIQIGVGLSGDGAYNADQETYYLKSSTSVMNALKILDSLINEAINNCNIEAKDTNTINIDIQKYSNSTTISANILVSTESGNGIIAKNDGIYHKITSSYLDGILTLYVNDVIVSLHVLGLAYIGILKAYYDSTTESLVLVFKKEDSSVDELRIPVTSLIREWTIDNSGVSDVVILTRIEDYTGGPDKLSADVRLFSDKYNILTKEGNSLYVKGTADNIVWNDVKVSIILDSIQTEILGLKDSDSNIVSITNTLRELLDAETTRALAAEESLQSLIDSINSGDISSEEINNLILKLDQEINRSTTMDELLLKELSLKADLSLFEWHEA